MTKTESCYDQARKLSSSLSPREKILQLYQALLKHHQCRENRQETTIRWYYILRTALILQIYHPSTNNLERKRRRVRDTEVGKGKKHFSAIISFIPTSVPSTSNLLTFSILRGLCSSPWHTLSMLLGPLPRETLLSNTLTQMHTVPCRQ